jgi:uncharacterized protein (DUF885 family)
MQRSITLLCFLVAADASAAEVTTLADEYVAAVKESYPEVATFSGLALDRHDGLMDNSQAGRERWEAFEDRIAKEVGAIDSATLRGKPDWVIHGFLREAVESGRVTRVCRTDLWSVNQMSGWQTWMTQLASIQPVGSEKARGEALARWRKVPRFIDNEIANLRIGLREGYSTPKRNVELVIEQLDQLLGQPVEKWPLYNPATRDDSEEFRKAWAGLLTSELTPAIRRYRDYLASDYVGKARTSIAIAANPNGEACYHASFRNYTTIDRPAKETFDLGMKRVQRNLEAALEIGRTKLDAKDLPALLRKLDQDPANHFKSREELLEFARAAIARAKTGMPKWFVHVPKAALVVEPYPEMLERTASDSYWPAAEDGSRPATYRITLFRYPQTTRANAEITAFHEGWPGHHLQISIAQERPNAHPITRLVGNSGFAEGWARYSEALAEEMGMYTSDYARANRRLWPARGMVIDPGIHLLGWTREKAMAFARESGRFEGDALVQLVDRIAVWPGQLTAYDTGALEFFALRCEAEKALGDRFDIRQFHSVVLENGTITLPMLREHVQAWLAKKKKGAPENRRSPASCD